VSAVYFDVHGVRVELSGDAEALAGLCRHFAAFAVEGPLDAAVTIALERRAPRLELPARLRAEQILERGVVYNDGARTWVDHHGAALSHYDFGRERGSVVAPDPVDLIELGYLMIHSRLGVLLEARGLVRLHALGLAMGSRAALVLCPSGGGKSRLAITALRHGRTELLGDDIVLLDAQGRAHGFPQPLGIPRPEAAQGLGPAVSFVRRHHPPKWLVELGPLEPRLARGPRRVALVALCRRVSAAPSRLVPASRAELAGELWRDLVIGLGLPQVFELVARRGARDLGKLAPSAFLRGRRALAVARGARGVVLEVFDPESAIAALEAELERDSEQ
jgi:hypothetical protein